MEAIMSIVKVIEVVSEGDSVESAIKSAVVEAARTIESIVQVDVEHIKGVVEKNKIVKFRVNAKISFLVKHPHPEHK